MSCGWIQPFIFRTIFFCAASLLPVLSLAVPPSTNEIISLRQAVQMARENNPTVLGGQARIRQAEEEVPLARANLLPNLNLIASNNYRKDAVSSPTSGSAGAAFGGEPYNVYQADLRLNQPLFVYGSFSAVREAKKEIEMRNIDKEILLRDLTANVIQAYYRIVLSSRNLEALLRQRRLVRESLAVAQRREQTGRGQLIDVLQTKTRLALLEPQIANAQNDLQINAATLANFLGDRDAREVRLESRLLTPALADVDRAVELKKFRLPELERDNLAIAQIEDKKAVSLGANLPYLVATADYYYTNTAKSEWFNDNSRSWQVGVVLTIPLFSGFSSIHQQRSLAEQRRQLEYDRIHLENDFTLRQVSARKKLESAEHTLSWGKEALRLAEISSDEARRNYRLATIDFLKFLSVEDAYVQAEQALNDSRYNYLLALVNYYVASGQNIDSLLDILERTKS